MFLVGFNKTKCSKLVMSIQLIYSNAGSRVWVYSSFSDDFLVQLRLHYSSAPRFSIIYHGPGSIACRSEIRVPRRVAF